MYGVGMKARRCMIRPGYVRGTALPHLRVWRLQKFLGQAELAQKAGVTRGTIARAERGDEVVSFANIRKIADALGISTQDLVTKNPEGGA